MVSGMLLRLKGTEWQTVNLITYMIKYQLSVRNRPHPQALLLGVRKDGCLLKEMWCELSLEQGGHFLFEVDNCITVIIRQVTVLLKCLYPWYHKLKGWFCLAFKGFCCIKEGLKEFYDFLKQIQVNKCLFSTAVPV